MNTPTDPTEGLLSMDDLMADAMGEAPLQKPAATEAPAETAPESTAPDTPAAPAEPEAKPAEVAPAGEQKKGAAALLDEPAEAKKEDAKPAEEALPASIASDPKAGEVFKAMRAEKAAAEKEASRLSAELNELKKLKEADPVSKKAEELERMLAEKDERLARFDIREKESYKKEITIPLEAAEDDALRIAKENELDASKVMSAIYTLDRKKYKEAMAELTEAMPEIDKLELLGTARRIRELSDKGIEIEKNAKAASAEAAARDKEASDQKSIETKATQMRAVSDFHTKAADKLSKYVAIEGGDAPEVVMKSILDEALSTPFSEMEAPDQAAAVWALAASSRMKKAYDSAVGERDKTIESLRRQLGGAAKASPSTSGVADPAKDQDVIPDSPEAMFARTFGS